MIKLILVPGEFARGGITNYYQSLRLHFSNDIVYFQRGARTWPIRRIAILELWRAWKDYKAFRRKLRNEAIILVQTTTSLGLNSIIRDGLFIRYAKKRGIKAIVFFRGWDDSVASNIEKRYLFIFKFFFFGSDAFLTLSEKAKSKIEQWGYNKEIHVETTLVDQQLLLGIDRFSVNRRVSSLNNSRKVNLLFLSRVERMKGVFDLLSAFKILTNNSILNYDFCLDICGDGLELENVNEWIVKENIKNVKTHGFVKGEEKKLFYDNAHIFILPSYTEGMPNAILEAMGFGLPVITTAVGGIVDFFIPGENGYFIDINNADDIVKKIELLLADESNYVLMSLRNLEKANKLFRSDIVAKRIETIFQNVIRN